MSTVVEPQAPATLTYELHALLQTTRRLYTLAVPGLYVSCQRCSPLPARTGRSGLTRLRMAEPTGALP